MNPVSAPPPQPSLPARHPDRLAVVLIYLVLAGLWILAADQAIAWLFADHRLPQLASTLKDLVLVAATSLLLFVLLRDRGEAPVAMPVRRPLWPLLLAAVLVAGATALAIAQIYRQRTDVEVARLQAGADLKARQVADWLREREDDAEFVASSDYYARQLEDGHDRGDPVTSAALWRRLELLARQRGFTAVSLLDGQGRRLGGTALAPAQPVPELQAAVRALKNGSTGRVGPYIGRAGHVRLDFLAPLRLARTSIIVVLHADPGDWMTDTLQAWPVPSASGETVLVRRDGDAVVYLNDLRHRRGQALRLRQPLAALDLPAAQVLRGEATPGEVVRGHDYRGVPVIGVVRAVPGTDWYLLAKLDRAEMYWGFGDEALWVAIAGLLALVLFFAAWRLFHQHRQLAEAAAVQQAQAKHLHALHLMAAIANSSQDAIFAQDSEGRYVLFNKAAERNTGKSAAEVIGRDETALFPPEVAGTLIDDNHRVLDVGMSRELEETLPFPDGEHTVWTTKSPLRDLDGKIIGLLGMSRDITERKGAEAALRSAQEDLAATLRAIPDLLFEVDKAGRYLKVQATAPQLLSAPTEQLLGRTVAEMLPVDAAGTVMAALAAAAGNGTDYGRVISLPLPDGAQHFELSVASKRMPDGQPDHFIVLSRDITERHDAETELRARNDELERFNRATVGRELDMIELKKRINALSRELGRAPPYPLHFEREEP